MIVKSRLCDKCGKKIDNLIYRITKLHNIRILFRTPNPYWYSDYDFELCYECGKSVVDFIRDKPKEVTHE